MWKAESHLQHYKRYPRALADGSWWCCRGDGSGVLELGVQVSGSRWGKGPSGTSHAGGSVPRNLMARCTCPSAGVVTDIHVCSDGRVPFHAGVLAITEKKLRSFLQANFLLSQYPVWCSRSVLDVSGAFSCITAEAALEGARLSGIEFQVYILPTVGRRRGHGSFQSFPFLPCHVQSSTEWT